MALHEPRAFLDADEAQPALVAGPGDVESLTVVGRRQRGPIIGARLPDRDVPRIPVFRRLPERFLRDPKPRQRDRLGRRFDADVRDQTDLDVVLALHLRAVRLESGDQPDVLQHARMKIVREQPQRFGHPGDARVNVGEGPLNGAPVDVAPAQQIADLDGDAGHFLTGIVMQVARDAPALGFLADDQPSGQVAAQRQRPFRLGDVAHDAQHAIVLYAHQARFEVADSFKRKLVLDDDRILGLTRLFERGHQQVGRRWRQNLADFSADELLRRCKQQ